MVSFFKLMIMTATHWHVKFNVQPDVPFLRPVLALPQASVRFVWAPHVGDLLSTSASGRDAHFLAAMASLGRATLDVRGTPTNVGYAGMGTQAEPGMHSPGAGDSRSDFSSTAGAASLSEPSPSADLSPSPSSEPSTTTGSRAGGPQGDTARGRRARWPGLSMAQALRRPAQRRIVVIEVASHDFLNAVKEQGRHAPFDEEVRAHWH